MINVGKSALFEDPRSRIFPPILEDPESQFTISWMLDPLYNIQPKTGLIEERNEKFDNKKYGIIVSSPRSRATFLPGVFSSETSWNKILDLILEKANLSPSKKYKLYAYETNEVSFRFYESFGEQFFPAYLNFLLSHKKLPYMVEKSGKVIYSDNEWVRNMAVLEGLDEYQLPYRSMYVNKLLDLFESRPREIRQSLTSLIELVDAKKKESICEYFELEIDDLEENFERPQVLISILRNCKKKNEIKILIDKMMKEANRDIFRLNWDAQLLVEASKIWKEFQKFAEPIDLEIYPILESFDKNTMTNELAVGFECLCSLLQIKKDLRSKKWLMKVILLLWERWDPKRGLYRFLDGEERIDITNHIIHGQKLLLITGN
jgi:hypothetical protein